MLSGLKSGAAEISDSWRAMCFVLIPIILGLDQLTKWLVLRDSGLNALGCLDKRQACGGYEVSPVFDITMVWNRGISFGAFQSEGIMRWVLTALIFIIIVGFVVWLLRIDRWISALALGLVIGGAIGNVIDRIRFGAVVDFLDFSDIWFIWIFNIADAAITIGALLLILDQFILSEQSE